MPTSLSYGLKGNSPTLGGANEDAYNYSIGLSGKLQGIHKFTVQWIDSHARYKKSPNGLAYYQYTNGSPVSNDHGWLSFSYQATF